MLSIESQSERLEVASPFWLTRTERRIVLLVFFCAVIARFSGLLPAYSLDDYQGFLNPAAYKPTILSQGRDVEYWLWSGLIWLGAGPPYSAVLGWIALNLTLISIGIFLCRYWQINDRPVPSALVILILLLYPYQTEIFTFRQTTLFLAVALLLAFGGMAICAADSGKWLLSSLLISLSLLIYQIALNYLVVTLLTSTFFLIDKSWRGQRFRNWLWQAAAITGGVVLFVVESRVFIHVHHLGMAVRAQVLSMTEVQHRADLVTAELGTILFRSEPVLPVGAKILLISVILAGCLSFAARGNWKVMISFLLLVTLTLPACIGLTVVSAEWWPVPRVMAQTGFFWAAIVGFVLTSVGRALGQALTLILSLVVIIMIGNDNRVLADQLRLNRRDAAKANRIVMRLEELPDFAILKGLVLTPGRWYYASSIGSVEGDLNTSAFLPAWARLNLINEVSGYNFAAAPDSIQAQSTEYCRSAPAWPAPKSVTSLGGYGVVCLEK